MADTSRTRRERRAEARAERQERERAEAARARQRRRLFQLGGALALAAAVIVVIVLATGSGGDDAPEQQAGESVAGQNAAVERYRGIPQDGIVLGDPRAPVTFVEFADLQCPYCRDYAEQVMPTLVDDYVRTGRVKMVFQNLAFLGTDSVRAAQMAGALSQQDGMWEFADIFYANQGMENSGYVTDDFLRRVAGGVPGADVDRAFEARGSADVARLIDEAQAQADEHGISGTPSFLVGPTGGELQQVEVNAGFPVEDFTTAIDNALQQAR